MKYFLVLCTCHLSFSASSLPGWSIHNRKLEQDRVQKRDSHDGIRVEKFIDPDDEWKRFLQPPYMPNKLRQENSRSLYNEVLREIKITKNTDDSPWTPFSHNHLESSSLHTEDVRRKKETKPQDSTTEAKGVKTIKEESKVEEKKPSAGGNDTKEKDGVLIVLKPDLDTLNSPIPITVIKPFLSTSKTKHLIAPLPVKPRKDIPKSNRTPPKKFRQFHPEPRYPFKPPQHQRNYPGSIKPSFLKSGKYPPKPRSFPPRPQGLTHRNKFLPPKPILVKGLPPPRRPKGLPPKRKFAFEKSAKPLSRNYQPNSKLSVNAAKQRDYRRRHISGRREQSPTEMALGISTVAIGALLAL